MGIEWDEIGVYKCLKEKKSPFIGNIDKMIKYSETVLPYINRVFTNYTSHGIEHSKMVIKYMSDLIDDIDKISELELTVIIYCGLLHDIGMVVTDEEINNIKLNKFELTQFKYECVNERIKDEKLSLQEIIRPIHGKKSRNYIINMFNNSDEKNLFCIPNKTNIYFVEEVANISMSHNEDFDWSELNLNNDDIKGDYKLNSQYVSLLLRIADLLDIDESRTPLYLYNLINPKGISELEWKQHFLIENNEKIILNKNTGLKEIVFYGESNEANIHRKILKYIDYINKELKSATTLSETMKNEYILKIKPVVANRIRTSSFKFSDFKLTLDYSAVTNLLMGENIYGDRKYGLREIIQNSIDACKLMREEAQNIQQYRREKYNPYIRIEIDKDRNKLTIADNGIGMSLDILKKYFFNVGVSYYSSNEYKFRGYNYQPIGNYGIGFLSCFMLSDEVTVITKRFNENKINKVDMEKQSEYICLTQKDEVRVQGTDIILDYLQFTNIFSDIKSIKEFIDNNFIDNEIPIIITELNNSGICDYECNLVSLKTEEEGVIRLDKYLNNISGYMNVKLKNIKFVENLGEISEETAYVYDENLLEKTTIVNCEDIDNIKISNYIEENIILYVQVPIIEKKDKDYFENAYEILEDYDEALAKLGNYDSISIFCNEDYIQHSSDVILGNNEYIIGEFSTDDLSQVTGHCKDVQVSVELKKQLIVDIGKKIFLCYRLNDRYYSSFNKQIRKIFVRDVLVSKCEICIPSIAEGIEIQDYIFNINNREVIPDISRTNINNNILNELSYAIGKALHLWIYENLELSVDEKELIKKFIEINYDRDNRFLYSYNY
ncbi:ATP-binding protein [Clostridium botulinum]|uniref:HD domain-containing protein n=1 Tax=Clostridium botulinum TaxID=1491 RepID=UPI001C9AE6C5|nr:ATP-binding protein [Clostridium botulinum]MBY6811877.1 ATP-binding protein [Clostridium botulinum]MBY6825359.1 ATP-binding protein [Clostridium botulinum]MBY6835698.1 ATP-binding protein [Clostridium botulinum]MBY6974388.1 ATP-binding protein [Clostridium botulinum]MCS6105447.1 HD domain-containing protein [Clostridium botulinum]